jgi:hypothetical protein
MALLLFVDAADDAAPANGPGRGTLPNWIALGLLLLLLPPHALLLLQPSPALPLLLLLLLPPVLYLDGSSVPMLAA